MDKEKNKIVMELIINDLKYLSVRFLYFNWFFPSGAEVANQLIDSIIKVYLKSIGRADLINRIRSWKGNETHNIVRILELIIEGLKLDFNLGANKVTLENIYKIYQNRYLDNLEKIGACQTLLKDINTIDYIYKYFRDKINISEKKKGGNVN
ncbi:hypothetical protein HY750_03750 [Candidatus Kuenenbacteria bacterium]|nr:hypothetical protein [Candidatus Kuenenbacteria bacterium]